MKSGKRKKHISPVGLLVLSLVAIALVSSGCGPDRLPPTEVVTVVKPTATDPATEPTDGPSPSPEVQVTELTSYVNEPYGFSFRYPASWELVDGRNYVSLSQGTTSLVIGYRHMSEDPNICCRGHLPEGEIVEVNPVPCAGEEVDKALLVCEGETKAVVYEDTNEIAVGELRFLFYLEDFGADYATANIPPEVLIQVDHVITSLETFEPAVSFETATPRPTKLPPTPEPTPVPPTATPVLAIAEAQPEGTNVRAGPGTDFPRLGTLEGGAELEIVARHSDWWQVVYGDDLAWVYDGVVAASGTEGVPQTAVVPTAVSPSPTLIPTPAPPSAIGEGRWIDVDISEQLLTAYEGNQAVRSTAVSTGLPQTPTVMGQFRIWIKLRYDDMSGPDYYLEDVPYVMYFHRGYGLHGTFWHDNFGQPMSHGCVNLPTSEAAWVFDFVDVGTLVNVHE